MYKNLNKENGDSEHHRAIAKGTVPFLNPQRWQFCERTSL
jgi:hypothetical protein